MLNYKELQTIIAIITEGKVIEFFCIAEDFCKFFDAMTAKYTLKSTTKRQYHRASTMSKAEIMLIMILFHDSGYRCLKHFYLEKGCRHMRHYFRMSFPITVLLNWKRKLPSHWHCSSRRCFWANVLASALLTALLTGMQEPENPYS